MEQATDNTKTVPLTPAILSNINIISEQVRTLQQRAQEQVTLILDSFAQGSGITDEETWTLSSDNQSIIFLRKESSLEATA